MVAEDGDGVRTRTTSMDEYPASCRVGATVVQRISTIAWRTSEIDRAT